MRTMKTMLFASLLLMEQAMIAKPAAEMEKMKYLLGTWSCEGTVTDMGKPTTHPVKSTMKVTSELGGHWIVVAYDVRKTKESPMPFAFREVIGWDASNGKYERMFFDNMGNKATFSAAPVGADGKMEWTGEVMMGPMKVPIKDTMTYKSDKEVMVDVQAQGQDGKWMPVTNVTCTKG
jgi:hypothetical protein